MILITSNYLKWGKSQVCQLTIKTVNHYFLSCPLFKQQRLKLQSDLESKLQFSLNARTVNDMLYGRSDVNEKTNKMLFEIVHHYITATKKFDMK